MNFSNRFKIAWWLILVVALTVLLVFRFRALINGEGTPFDIVAFLVWVALLLIPLFQEIGLFGVKLKQQLDDLRAEIRTEITGLRGEIQNSISLRTSVNPQFFVGPGAPPSTDAQLPQVEEQVQRALNNFMKSYGVREAGEEVEVPNVPEDAGYLFRVRFNLEKELRRAWSERLAEEERRLPVVRLINNLVRSEVLIPELAYAVREVYAICSAAIHGEEVSSRQLNFVRDTAPELIASLRAIPTTKDYS